MLPATPTGKRGYNNKIIFNKIFTALKTSRRLSKCFLCYLNKKKKALVVPNLSLSPFPKCFLSLIFSQKSGFFKSILGRLSQEAQCTNQALFFVQNSRIFCTFTGGWTGKSNRFGDIWFNIIR
jgi:hypothetical protein